MAGRRQPWRRWRWPTRTGRQRPAWTASCRLRLRQRAPSPGAHPTGATPSRRRPRGGRYPTGRRRRRFAQILGILLDDQRAKACRGRAADNAGCCWFCRVKSNAQKDRTGQPLQRSVGIVKRRAGQGKLRRRAVGAERHCRTWQSRRSPWRVMPSGVPEEVATRDKANDSCGGAQGFA